VLAVQVNMQQCGAARAGGADQDALRVIKGPILRGLAGRAPYFHNGSAATLEDAVSFYDIRFSLHFSQQDQDELVALLKTP
jgi:cytochrome c peroxidase